MGINDVAGYVEPGETEDIIVLAMTRSNYSIVVMVHTMWTAAGCERESMTVGGMRRERISWLNGGMRENLTGPAYVDADDTGKCDQCRIDPQMWLHE